MEGTLNANNKTARQAAVVYFLLVLVASFGMGYVPSKIIARDDVVATANNILANEFLYRTGILCHLISTTAITVMVLMLYRLFRPVDKHLSRLMVVPVLIQLPIVFLLECFHIAALMTLKGQPWMTLNLAERQEFSYFLLRMHGYGIGAAQLFWGLWLFPFGMLIKRSGFIPHLFSVLLILNGIGYVTEACAYVLLQSSDYLLVRQFARYTFIGLPLTMLWFLVKGVHEQQNLSKTTPTTIPS